MIEQPKVLPLKVTKLYLFCVCLNGLSFVPKSQSYKYQAFLNQKLFYKLNTTAHLTSCGIFIIHILSFFIDYLDYQLSYSIEP